MKDGDGEGGKKKEKESGSGRIKERRDRRIVGESLWV